MVSRRSAQDKISRKKTSTIQAEVHSSENSSTAAKIVRTSALGNLENESYKPSTKEKDPALRQSIPKGISEMHSPLTINDSFLHSLPISKQRRNPRRSSTPSSSTVRLTDRQILERQLLALAYTYAQKALIEDMQAVQETPLAEKLLVNANNNNNNNGGVKASACVRTNKRGKENSSKNGENGAFKLPAFPMITNNEDRGIFIRLWKQYLPREKNALNKRKREETGEKAEEKNLITKPEPLSATWLRRVFLRLSGERPSALGFTKSFPILPKSLDPLQLTYGEHIFLNEHCMSFNRHMKLFKTGSLRDESRYEQCSACIMHYL